MFHLYSSIKNVGILSVFVLFSILPLSPAIALATEGLRQMVLLKIYTLNGIN